MRNATVTPAANLAILIVIAAVIRTLLEALGAERVDQLEPRRAHRDRHLPTGRRLGRRITRQRRARRQLRKLVRGVRGVPVMRDQRHAAQALVKGERTRRIAHANRGGRQSAAGGGSDGCVRHELNPVAVRVLRKLPAALEGLGVAGEQADAGGVQGGGERGRVVRRDAAVRKAAIGAVIAIVCLVRRVLLGA